MTVPNEHETAGAGRQVPPGDQEEAAAALQASLAAAESRALESRDLYMRALAELENVRNALRAWSAPRGLEVTDRPYEVYDSGIAGAFTEEGKFTAYWAIK